LVRFFQYHIFICLIVLYRLRVVLQYLSAVKKKRFVLFAQICILRGSNVSILKETVLYFILSLSTSYENNSSWQNASLGHYWCR